MNISEAYMQVLNGNHISKEELQELIADVAEFKSELECRLENESEE
jgi:hypothetical protein